MGGTIPQVHIVHQLKSPGCEWVVFSGVSDQRSPIEILRVLRYCQVLDLFSTN